MPASLGELLYRIAEHGVTLRCGRTEDRLSYSPPGSLPPELLTELKERKADIIQILREDEELKRTGVIQSERQVFDIAQEHFSAEEERRLLREDQAYRELDEDRMALDNEHFMPEGGA